MKEILKQICIDDMQYKFKLNVYGSIALTDRNLNIKEFCSLQEAKKLTKQIQRNGYAVRCSNTAPYRILLNGPHIFTRREKILYSASKHQIS